MVKKNQEIELKIESLNSEGMGVARVGEGFVVFCKDALPGDEVTAKIRKVKKNYAEAIAININKESPHRVKPRCKHFGVCGGCKVQNYSYDKQAEYKTDAVRNAFDKIGGIKDLTISPAIKSDNEYYYRNKMEFSFSDEKWLTNLDENKEKENFAVGFHLPRFHTKILDIEECFLQSEVTSNILNHARRFFKERGVSVYTTKTHSGYLRFLIVRECKRTDDLMVNLITYDYNEVLMNEYTEEMKKEFPLVTTLINSFTQKKAQVAFAEDVKILYGNGYITEKLIGGSKEYLFKISPNSFFQTNTLQAEKLYSTATEFGGFTKGDNILDLYCGTGSISIYISEMVNKVKGVELIVESIESARENAKLNGIENAEFEVSDIKDFLLNFKDSTYNKVILDPPRSGLHPDICEVLSGSDFEKIVYVSCNPVTQARDLSIIMNKGKYRIGRVQPVDMFPQTYHVENVVEILRD
ncbi:MAG: 23S rRNA (uracil(1939)-C(5))-methyltransferase RlmD [Ignavibacteria bacterium]